MESKITVTTWQLRCASADDPLPKLVFTGPLHEAGQLSIIKILNQHLNFKKKKKSFLSGYRMYQLTEG